MTIGAGLNAVYQLGGFEAGQQLMNGEIAAAGQTIANRSNFTTIVASALPFVGIWGIKKVIGQRTIYGPIKLF